MQIFGQWLMETYHINNDHLIIMLGVLAFGAVGVIYWIINQGEDNE